MFGPLPPIQSNNTCFQNEITEFDITLPQIPYPLHPCSTETQNPQPQPQALSETALY